MDADDGGIQGVVRRTRTSAPANQLASPPPAARPAAVATPTRALSVASTSTVSSTGVPSCVRVVDGWCLLPLSRVKHGGSSRSLLAATLQPPDPNGIPATQATHQHILATQENAIITTTQNMQAMQAHAGQLVWVRTQRPATSASASPASSTSSFSLARVWPADKTARTGSRLLLSMHASSPLSDDSTVSVRTLASPIIRARTVRVRRSPATHADNSDSEAAEQRGSTRHTTIRDMITTAIGEEEITIALARLSLV